MAGRQLRGVSGEETIKAFVKAGGVLRHGKGDHVNIKMPNGQLITIPSEPPGIEDRLAQSCSS